MSRLSGYDSGVVGFDSVTKKKNKESSSSTQTSDFFEAGVGSQTNLSRDQGCNIGSNDFNIESQIPAEYPPPGLNDFLRRVVPTMIEQLDQREKEILFNSSDSEEEDLISAKLFQELKINDNATSLSSGDHTASVLSVDWSSAGNSIAVSLGQSHHEDWCEHEGLIRIYTVRRMEDDQFAHCLDISEKNCITVVKYHPSLAALLAYGTTAGEVVLCDLRNVSSASCNQGMQLTCPPGFHSSNRVSALQWADATLANTFLIMQIMGTRNRRCASDQILISAGCDGTVNIWQINANLQVFQNVISYRINGASKMAAPVISCFDFLKNYPLRPSDQKTPEDIFVVGTTSGHLYLCNLKKYIPIVESAMVDPVFEVLDGHSTCVLDVAFSFQKSGIFASISMDSELRVYDVRQAAPLKVICMDSALSCMSWVPNNPSLVIVGLAKLGKNCQMVKMYSLVTGRTVPMEGLTAEDCEGVSVTSISVNQSGTCRIAAGDDNSTVRVWDIPLRRLKLTAEDLEF